MSREYISKKNEFEMVGCVLKKTSGSARSGLVGLKIITTQGKEENLMTYSHALLKGMENHIGECFSFTVYRHSFLIPNVGYQYVVAVYPIDTKNKGEL